MCETDHSLFREFHGSIQLDCRPFLYGPIVHSALASSAPYFICLRVCFCISTCVCYCICELSCLHLQNIHQPHTSFCICCLVILFVHLFLDHVGKSTSIFHFVFVFVSLAPYFAQAAANLPELPLLHVVFIFLFVFLFCPQLHTSLAQGCQSGRVTGACLFWWPTSPPSLSLLCRSTR